MHILHLGGLPGADFLGTMTVFYYTVFLKNLDVFALPYIKQVFVLCNSFIESGQFVPLSHKPYSVIHF